MASFDPEIRKSFARFLKLSAKRPGGLFEKIYAQPLVLEQPLEMIDEEINLCDGCINMMIYRNRLIPSCRMDEYRLFGAPIIPRKIPQENVEKSHRRRA